MKLDLYAFFYRLRVPIVLFVDCLQNNSKYYRSFFISGKLLEHYNGGVGLR